MRLAFLYVSFTKLPVVLLTVLLSDLSAAPHHLNINKTTERQHGSITFSSQPTGSFYNAFPRRYWEKCQTQLTT